MKHLNKTNFKGLLKSVTLVAILLLATMYTNAQLSGIVFRDYNGDGVRQNATNQVEPGVAGISVRAYNAADLLVATQVTNAVGTYAFPVSGANSLGAGFQVRLEFILPTTGCDANGSFDFASLRASVYGSNVQFRTAGPSVTANFGINDPAE